MDAYTDKISVSVHKENSTYCRICANKDPENMTPIFNIKGDFWSIAEKINRCLHIIVHPSDVLPLSLCNSCLKKLDTCHELIETAESAEKQLKAIFGCESFLDDGSNEDFREQEQGNLQKPIVIYIKQEVNGNLDNNLESTDDKVSSEVNNVLNITNSRNVADDRNVASSLREVEVKYEGKTKTADKSTFIPQLTIDGPATCDLCNALFIDMDEFDIHIENEHKQKTLWICVLCDNTFKSSSELISHKALVHQEEAVSCDKCKNMLIKNEHSDLDNKDSDTNDDDDDDDNDSDGEIDTEYEFNIENEDDYIEEYEEGFNVLTSFNSSNESKDENSEYVCNTCRRSFKSQTDLDEHQLVHVPKQVTCSQCGHLCSSLFDLSIHKKEHLHFARDRLHICEICCKSFVTHNALIVHQRHCTGKEEFTCNICNTVFAHELSLQLHLKGHEQRKRVYECDCGEKCDTYASFNLHKRTHSDTPARKCVTCHKEFNNSKRYKRHRYIHDPAFWDRYMCQICKKPFRDAQALSNHMQLHTGLKPHMCDLCGRTYNRCANMLKHRRLHKPQNLWEHICGQCDAKFERAKDLAAHMVNVHPPSQPADENLDTPKKSGLRWVCRFCGKAISSKLSLQDHERIHTGAKPYICEWCGREFRSRPNLLQHHLTHTGDRRHACPVCGKRFSRKSFITQHMRVHTGEKPFVCDICGKRFTQAGDMRRHRIRHTTT